MSEIPSSHHQEELADWQSVAEIMHTWHPHLQTHAKRIIYKRGIPVDLTTHQAQSGRNVSVEGSEQSSEKVMLDREAIRPNPIERGGTEIVLQRHGKYIRDRADPEAGKLTPDAIQLETQTAEKYFSELITQTPEDERDSLNILFVSSDTSYANNGRRSYQTTEIAQQVAERLFQENGIHLLGILNISPNSTNHGNPVEMQTLREPKMLEKSPDFVSLMREKYGDLGMDFWVAFEEDTEREARLEMGAEGPDEIADRMNAALRVLTRYSQAFHSQNPSSRLVVWAGTHYDTISPFVKRDVLHQDKSTAVLVDYGGGLVVDINNQGTATTSVASSQFEVKL